MSFSNLSKKEWRAYFKNQTDLFLKNKSQDVFVSKWIQSLSAFFKEQKGFWGVFSPLFGEPPVDQYLQSEEALGKVLWLFPKIQGQEMAFYQSDKFEKHPWGIKEPVSGLLVEATDIQGILVPGLGFNHKGQRLGRGKGFYDRYLQNYKGKKVGACYGFQLVNEGFPVEAWDVNMDSILTENGIQNCREGQ